MIIRDVLLLCVEMIQLEPSLTMSWYDGWLLQVQNDTTNARLQQEIEQRDDLLQR